MLRIGDWRIEVSAGLDIITVYEVRLDDVPDRVITDYYPPLDEFNPVLQLINRLVSAHNKSRVDA